MHFFYVLNLNLLPFTRKLNSLLWKGTQNIVVWLVCFVEPPRNVRNGHVRPRSAPSKGVTFVRYGQGQRRWVRGTVTWGWFVEIQAFSRWTIRRPQAGSGEPHRNCPNPGNPGRTSPGGPDGRPRTELQNLPVQNVTWPDENFQLMFASDCEWRSPERRGKGLNPFVDDVDTAVRGRKGTEHTQDRFPEYLALFQREIALCTTLWQQFVRMSSQNK